MKKYSETDCQRVAAARLADGSVRIPFSDCVYWAGLSNSKGYGLVNIKTKFIKAHRLAYELAYGAIPDVIDGRKACVLHRCDERSCVNPNHLFLGTQSTNMADMVSKKRSNFGSKSPVSKITEKDVHDIRNRCGSQPQAAIAHMYGIDQSTVSLIVNKKLWKHVGKTL